MRNRKQHDEPAVTRRHFTGAVLSGAAASACAGSDPAPASVPTPTIATVDENLTRMLRVHRDTFAPVYAPDANSDHAPMALLALHALGARPSTLERFAQSYQARLNPLQQSKEARLTNLDSALGQRSTYSALLQFFDAEIAQRGATVTVQRYLPRLSSGWVIDAYHPFIRLAYGVEFGVASEVAAGLAYLASCGPDAHLDALADAPALAVTGRDYLLHIRTLHDETYSVGRFNARYARVVSEAKLSPAAPTKAAMADLSLACLEVFNSTHDFFALHLVTASHAAHVCAPLAGPRFDALYSIGIAAGFLAIGAPQAQEFTPIAPEHDVEIGLDPDTALDEHDIKLAYTCKAQSTLQADPRYRFVAANYLS